MNKSTATAILGATLIAISFTAGYHAGILNSPESIDEMSSPPINTSANLTINVLNHDTMGMEGQVWVYDDMGRELYYCSTFIHHSGRPNLILVAWDNVTEYDGTIFTITVRASTRSAEPTTITKEVEWLCRMGRTDTLVITLG